MILSLNLILCVDAGVDLSCIVKAIPAVSSDDKEEEQTHEVLQVRPTCLIRTILTVLVSVDQKTDHLNAHLFFTCRLWIPSKLENVLLK